MKRLVVYCEGNTEAKFVEAVLRPYFLSFDAHVTSRICETKRTPTKKYTGGGSDYCKIKRELSGFCKSDRNAMFTTMFDYYALPKNTPGVNMARGSIYGKAEHIERTVEEDLGSLPNLMFNLVVHEFEGLLFSDISKFSKVADSDALAELQKIRNDPHFPTPEHINDSPNTAPSKRIKAIVPRYEKSLDGTDIAQDIGITKITAECHHFAKWLEKLTVWAKEGAQ